MHINIVILFLFMASFFTALIPVFLSKKQKVETNVTTGPLIRPGEELRGMGFLSGVVSFLLWVMSAGACVNITDATGTYADTWVLSLGCILASLIPLVMIFYLMPETMREI